MRFSLRVGLVLLLALGAGLLGMVYSIEDLLSQAARPIHVNIPLDQKRQAIQTREEAKALAFFDARAEEEDFTPIEHHDHLNAASKRPQTAGNSEEDPESVFPLLSKPMSFGERQGYRKAHVLARELLRSKAAIPNNPVLDLDSNAYVPFRSEFVRQEFKHLPRIIIEAEYFRFEDELGLISTEWTDEQVVSALQRLVNVYAQGNIQIRLRVEESLAKVKLSRMRSLAYWFYVDYPRNPTNQLSPKRLERKLLMDKVLGIEYVELLKELDGERQGLFDFMMGWPEERTAWENVNVVGMYPSFYYQFMNGGGNLGCMRFRTGDCNTLRPIRLSKEESPQQEFAHCFRFGKKSGDDPAVRQWERYNFTAEMAIRLVAHEFGHSVRLHHAKVEGDGGGCQKVHDWDKTNLMHQVLRMAPAGHTCRVTGWPELAAKATYLTNEQIAQARANIKYDLRQSPTVLGAKQIGPSTEVLAESCSSVTGGTVQSFVPVPAMPASGKIKRIRWKSAAVFDLGDQVRISIGRFENNQWQERAFQLAALHSLGSHVHQEQDVDLDVVEGESVVLSAESHLVDLLPQSHVYANPTVLGSDVANLLPMKQRDHPTISNLMSAKDQNSLYPNVASFAPTRQQLVQIQSQGKLVWKTWPCAKWVFNLDLA
ncbi:hypothetical protein BASA81_005347 [Batrachochytrium salamandrivorans]|nr:hypothetical protein BASA81_005347 [Batrachochytrium salamandrivorans]